MFFVDVPENQVSVEMQPVKDRRFRGRKGDLKEQFKADEADDYVAGKKGTDFKN